VSILEERKPSVTYTEEKIRIQRYAIRFALVALTAVSADVVRGRGIGWSVVG